MNATQLNALSAMLEKGQDNALLRYSLGNAYLEQEDYATATEHFAKAIEHDEGYSAAWKGYGKALVGLDNLQRAAEVYAQGIAIAEQKGDKQTAKEMQVFLKRVQKSLA